MQFEFGNGTEALKRPLLTAALLCAGAILANAASFIFGIGWLTPFLGAAVPYPLFLQQVRRSRYASALGWMLVWAVFHSVATIVATGIAPAQAAAAIPSGPPYVEEMFHWIRTGEGAEGSLALFLPIHLKHYILFCLLSLVTASSAALVLGTWMLDYMNFYVAQLMQASVSPWLAALVGWPLWSYLRVIGFITTGIALTVPAINLLARIQRRASTQSFPWQVLGVGIGFVLADIVVKATVAPFWRQWLLQALDGVA